MPRNPYLNRSMIRSVEEFYGRQPEIERIAARIGATTMQSVSIVGERRSGKSSLLWHLSRPEVYRRYLDEPKRYLFTLIDCQRQQNLDLAGFCRVFGTHLNEATPPQFSIPELHDFAGVEAMIQRLEEQNLRLVCLFDEFETITRNSHLGAEFFGLLRSLANAYPIAFVTASRRDLQTLCSSREIAESPFFNIFTHLHLGPLRPAEALTLISTLSARSGLDLRPHSEALIALGSHLPFYLQIACSAAFECLVEQGNMTWDQAFIETRFLEETTSHFRYLWDHFESDQRQLIGLLAQNQHPQPHHTMALQQLANMGYLTITNRRPKLFSSAFTRFLQENLPDVLETAAPSPPTNPDTSAAALKSVGQTATPLPLGVNPFPQLIGQSPAIRTVYRLIQKAAETDVTVLLLGETGTGKELVARTIHEHSPRKDTPFIPLNCAAVAPQLLESELFGHKKGAFTDAGTDRQGLFEAAHGGTLFLDEIGETTPAVQVKLLRFLQEGEIRRVGENTQRRVQVRLICATNRDLEEEITQGRFRQDFYYRLYVLPIVLPSLKERVGDIPMLVEHFLEDYPGGLDPATMAVLQAYSWPGNIRELENQIDSAKTMAGGQPLHPSHLWSHLNKAVSPPTELNMPQDLPLREAREYFERLYIAAKLHQCHEDLDKTAKALGLSRSRLYELVRRYGLKTG